MSLQFSRSLRILRIDSYRAARIGLILAMFLMIGLLAWFFLAKVTLFENSTQLNLQQDGRILATFSDEGMQRIQLGQAALLRLNTGSEQPAVILPASVYDLLPGSNQVELVLLTDEIPPETFTGKSKGRAEVEVEYITPAQLLFRATGKALDQANLPVSPQNINPEGGTESP